MHHHHPPAQSQQRRRKKRPNYGTRTVEVRRGYNGFGFTISGQQPCRLSCIVANSPADQAGLRAGDFLISVNNLNVSKLPHETVVQLIGNSFGSIRMQIAENYFSDSSDEENALLLHSGASTAGGGGASGTRMKPSYLHHKMKMNRLRNSPQKSRAKVSNGAVGGGGGGTPTRSAAIALRPVIEDIPLLAMAPQPCRSKTPPVTPPTTTAYDVIPKANAVISNDISNVSAMVRIPARQPQHAALEYRAVVGYLGTIEMPRQISNSSKLQTVRSCIRKLRQEKRQPTTVLMTILPDCLRLQAVNGNVLASYTAARLNYVSSSSESENRFFGLVTSAIHTMQADDDEQDEDDEDAGNVQLQPQQRNAAYLAAAPSGSNISISNSCHVFIIDTKLCEHTAHVERAREFHIECTKDPITSLCLEFPNNSEYVVNLIRSMYTMRLLPPASRHPVDIRGFPHELAQANSPQPSNHSEVSTTTSNSDSGIGFHNDCTNISDRILVVDFPVAQLLPGVAPARLARPLGIFNNIDVPPPPPAFNNNNNSNIECDKRLTVRAMPDPKTPPLPRPLASSTSKNAPNLLESFNLIRSPATSLTATRSCDDVLALMERTTEPAFSLPSTSSCNSLQQQQYQRQQHHQQQQRRKSMQMSMDDISLHSTSQLYAHSIEATPAQPQQQHTFLYPASVMTPAKHNAIETSSTSSYSLLQDCRNGAQSSLQKLVPNKLSPKVYGVPAVKSAQSSLNGGSNGNALLQTRRSFGQQRGTGVDDEFGSWSSLQDIHGAFIERSTKDAMRKSQLEATNSEPDLGNRALPTNASPFRRAWGQSSFRTPRTDKHTLQPTQQHLNNAPHSPPVRRTASMNASDNDVYIKSMDNYFDDLKHTHSQQHIAADDHHQNSSKSKSSHVKFGSTSATADKSKTTPDLILTAASAKKPSVGPVGVSAWGTSFERLLEDPAGLHTFAEFLKKEFSAENIYFWTACERFRLLDSETERASQAMAIFSKHLANGSLEPVNVDSQARNLTEEKLQSAERDIFAQAQKQIFNLMKFDSYQRFIRSDMYKSCLEAEAKNQPLPYAAEDLDELLKTNFHHAASSTKLKKSASNAEDRRRKSLLPWHRKTRCKSRDRTEPELGGNKLSSMSVHHASSKLPQLSSSSSLKIPSTQNSMSDVHSSRSSLSSFDALPIGSGVAAHAHDEIKPCSLCRVILSDGATTIVQTRPGDTVGHLVERLLEKRGLSYAFYDVVINGSTKSIDLQSPALETLAGKEVLIEQRVAFKLDLPDPKVISVKSKPKKQLHEVIRPILHKYNYCMDAVQVLKRDTHEQLDLSLPVTVADGQRLQIVLIKAHPPSTAFLSDYQNGLQSSKTTTKHSLPKSGVSFPNTKLTGGSANTNQSTLDEITNKVFNELLQNKVEAHSMPMLAPKQQLYKASADMCSLKSDDCASETSSTFDPRVHSNILGSKSRQKQKHSNSSSHSDETISINAVPQAPKSEESSISVAQMPNATAANIKKPIIAKLKAGVKLQVTERVAENQDALLEGLKRAQLARLEDQRGTEINFELPEFLKNKENMNAANKLRKVRANLCSVNKIMPTTATPTEDASSVLPNERPQPAPRLSITHKNNKTNISPMKIDEEDDAMLEHQNNNSHASNAASSFELDYVCARGPPPLPPKPKVLPIKPSNWGVTNATSSVSASHNKLHSVSTPASNICVNNNNNSGLNGSNPSIQMPSKIPIDISRKHLSSETGRCAYLEEPSSSFV